MTGNKKTVVYLDLEKRSFEIKVHSDLAEFLGGVGVALKLMTEVKKMNPLIFATGPLNSSFPFVSRICTLFYDNSGRLVESYGGGSLGLILSLTSFETIIIYGQSPRPTFINVSSEKVEFIDFEGDLWRNYGLPGRSSRLYAASGGVLVDDYFRLDPRLGQRMSALNLRALTVNSDRSFPLRRPQELRQVYQEILWRGRDLTVAYDKFPSCAGCPAGCSQSAEPEFTPSLSLSYCLVACRFAEKILENVPTVFSCLHALGLDYSHEDLEEVSSRVRELRVNHAQI